MEPTSIIALLLVSSLLMAWAEFYLPGGILGAAAAVAAMVAVIMVFFNMGPIAGLLVGSVVMVGFIFAIAWWMKIFDKTPIGKRMLMEGHSGPDETYAMLRELIGETGQTVTALMPSGKARLAGRDRDVVARTGMIEAGQEVRVVSVEGIRILVAPVDSP